MTLFHGLSAFPITPTDSHGRVESNALCRLLERIVKAGVNSIGLLGSTGGYVYLTRSERQRAVAAAAEFVGGRVPLIVGVGALRTDEAQQLARDARDAGAAGLLLAPVSYTPLTEEEVYQHFLAVARATDLPLCIYNNPGTTRFTFSYELLGRLSQIETLAAVKMPLPQGNTLEADLTQLRHHTRASSTAAGFAIGYSGDWGCAAGLLAGADTWYSVVGGLFPVQAMKLAKAAQAGDAVEVQRIDGFFQPLWMLFKEFGGLRVIYAAANILSLTDASPHLPILPLPPADQERVAEAIDALVKLD
ncbi:dihydrodipicolinate synthase family protein [Kiloniella laminariae]|uniref:Dihydrodipicolinate synthase family protein n=1 Tax=Kiloniella laminariae TaxID=454162 RepID=A0ABT4LH21_9PROT|nr:dihydrodipicolinate synthase family protein [Kiloniella laminariae]MCZ4280389.1 dihydrodipicolinate synthase family protein [Kiloniella laminariae]